MNPIDVEKNECRTVNGPDGALAAHNIGDEIVVTLYDAEAQVGGLLRFTQPDSRLAISHARQSLAMYADSGIAALIAETCRQGADKKRATVHIAGGAHIAQAEAAAKKNYLAARKTLWKIGLVVESETVGGATLRNVRLEVGTGRFWVNDADGASRVSGQEHPLKGTNLCLTVY